MGYPIQLKKAVIKKVLHGNIKLKPKGKSPKDWTAGERMSACRNVNGECSHEKRYYISSLDCDAKKFGNALRSHWGIENSVHWVLDIAFREDESRVKKGFAPENFAAI